MRKLLTIIGILLTLFGCGGGSDKPQTKADAPAYALIFMDKSVSVKGNQAFIKQKYTRAINDIVEQTVKQKGDKVEVYFIHENTAKARALTLTSRIEMDDLSQASATDREAAKTAFDLALQREKAIFRQQILAKLAEPNPNKSNQSTDILASIPVISRVAETGAAVAVFYLSDMVQSMQGQSGDSAGQRDFGKNPPSGRAQADEWAKDDAEQLKSYPIQSAGITMILPFQPTSSVKENNPAVTQYWRALFETLGVTEVSEQ